MKYTEYVTEVGLTFIISTQVTYTEDQTPRSWCNAYPTFELIITNLYCPDYSPPT